MPLPLRPACGGDNIAGAAGQLGRGEEENFGAGESSNWGLWAPEPRWGGDPFAIRAGREKVGKLLAPGAPEAAKVTSEAVSDERGSTPPQTRQPDNSLPGGPALPASDSRRL